MNWARIRACWKRKGITAFGVRIAEPHHHGTPHWHLLIFMKPTDRTRIRESVVLALTEKRWTTRSRSLRPEAAFE